MTDEIKLGELAFDAESFKQIIKSNGFCSESVIAVYSQELANVANRILREKLAKAPYLTGMHAVHEYFDFGQHCAGLANQYNRGGRLVCIEEIPNKKHG